MSENLDLIISSGMDQNTPLNTDWIMKQIHDIIQESVKQKNADIALAVFRELHELQKVSGLALAKGLYELYRHWPEFNIDEEFDDYVYIRIGLHHYTVERYIKIWRMYDEKIVPPELSEEIQGINIKDQVYIAHAISQGHEISQEKWEEIAHAPDGSSVRRIVQEIKQEPPRSNSCIIYLDREGDIWAVQNNRKEHVGMLDIGQDNSTVQKAIERIVSNAGMMRQ